MMTPRLRRRLFEGTAVAAALVLTPHMARADGLPVGGLVQVGTVTTTVGNGGDAAALGGVGSLVTPPSIGADAAATAVTFTLGTASAVINWADFDIAASRTVTFDRVGDTAFSVLNRVTSGAVTTIAGNLRGSPTATAGNLGTIWVINESGLTFTGSASVTNLTGLVASSLGVTDAAFALAATAGTRFTGTGIAPITVAVGAAITPESTLLLVAPKLTLTGGTVSATTGDAGFVVASDATVRLSAGGIVNVRIDAGTDITAGTSIIGATVGGQRVLVAAARNTDIVGALLSISGDLTATSAVATEKGIVLAAGRNVAIDGGEEIAFTAPDVGPPIVAGARFVAGIAATGTLTANDGAVEVAASGSLDLGAITSAADITLAATGNITAGALTADAAINAVSDAGSVTVASADAGTGVAITALLGTASVTGTVAAIDDYIVRGGSVVLGGGPGVVQSTEGNILIRSTTGGLTANAGLTLVADSAGAGNRLLILDSATAITGTADLRAGATALPADPSNRSDVLVRVGTGAGLSLGAIDADLLGTAVAAGDPATIGDYTLPAQTALVTTGMITLGSVTTVQSLEIGSERIDAADTIARTLTVAGAASQGTVLLRADANPDEAASSATLTIGDVRAFGGDATLTGTSAITLLGSARAIAASGNVALRSDGAVTVDAIRAGGTITTGGVATAAPTSFNGASLQANGAITITASGAIDTNPGTVATSRLALAADLSGFIDGAVADAGVTLTSTGGTVDAGSLAATGDIVVAAAGTASVGGAVTAGDASSLTGDYTVRGLGVSLGATSVTQEQAARRDVLIEATGTGAITTLGALTIAADGAGAGNRFLILDSGGAITGGANLRSGVGLAAATPRTAGNRSEIYVALADTAATVALGDIDADGIELATTAIATPLATDYSSTSTLVTTGPLSFGAMTLVAQNQIRSTGGALSIGSIFTRQQNIDLFAQGGALTVGSVTALGESGGGDITLRGTTGIARPGSGGPFTIAALDDVALRSDGAITVDVVRAGGTITAGGITAGTPAGSLAATSLRAAGAITIDSTASIDVIGATIETNRRAIIADLSAFTGVIVGDAPITLTSGGDLTANDLASTGSIRLTAGGAATVTGNVSAGDASTVIGDYVVKGGSVALGGAGTTQAAVGSVLARSSAGAVSVAGRLAADTDGTGLQSLILHSAGAITGGGALAAGTGTLLSTLSPVLLRLDSTTSGITLGAIDAQQVAFAAAPILDVYLPAIASRLVTAGAVTLGTITAPTAIEIGSTLGDVSVGGAISLTGGVDLHADAGALTTGTILSAAAVTLTGGTAITASGSVTAITGGITATAPALTLGTSGVSNAMSAPGAITLTRSGAGAITVRGAYSIVSGGGAVNIINGDTTGATLGQNGGLTLTGTSVRVGGVIDESVDPLATGGDVLLTATTGALEAGAVAARGNVIATATPGIGMPRDVTLGGATSGRAGSIDHVVTVSAAGGVAAVTGDVAASGDYSVVGRSVTLGGATATNQTAGGTATIRATAGGIARGAGTLTLAARGNLGLQADGAIAFTDLRSGGAVTIGGANVIDASGVTGGSVRANGAITVNASGAIGFAGGTVAVERSAIDANLVGFTGAAVGTDAAVVLASTAGLVAVGPVRATGSITLTAAGPATVAGTATAGDALSTAARDLAITGTSVALGGAAPGTTSATGDVLIRATTGGIATTTGHTIVADSAADGSATGVQRLVLDSAGAITGGAALRAGAVAPATSGARSDVFVRLGTGAALDLGAVTADQFALVDGAYVPVVADSVVTSGAVTLGAVDTVRSIAIGSTGGVGARDVVVGGVTSRAGSVEVRSDTGAVTVSAPVSAATSASLHADAGILNAGSVTALGGNATLFSNTADVTVGAVSASLGASLFAGGTLTAGSVTARGGAASLTGTTAIVAPASTIAALGNVTMMSNGAIGFDAVRAGGTVTIGDAIGSADSITGTSVRANGTIALTTNGPLALASLGVVATERNLIDADLAGFNGAASAGPANLTLRSTGGAVGAGVLAATGDIAVTSTTATATIAGATAVNVAVTAGGVATVSGAVAASGDYTVDGAAAVLGATGVAATQAAAGNVLVRASGAAGITALGTTLLVADGGGTGTRRLVLDSAGAIGTGADPVGDVALALRAGAPGAPALGTSSGVLIRLAAPGSPVLLGNIDALSLARAGTGPGYAPLTAGAFIADGLLTLGTVRTVQSSNIGSTTGPVSIDAASSSAGVVALRADANTLSAGNVSALTTASLTAGTALAATGSVFGGQAVTLTAGTSLAAGGTVTSATQGVTIAGGTTTSLGGTVTAGQAVVLSGGTSITAPASIVAGTAPASTAGVTLTAPVLTLGTIGATRGITAPGAITLTRTGGAVAITTLGNYAITSAGDAVSLVNGDASGATVDQTDSLALAGTRVTVGTITSTPAGTLAGAGDVVLAATGPAATDGIIAGGIAARAAITATAANGAVNVGAITAGQGVTLTAATAITAPGSIAAGTALGSTAGAVLTAPAMTLGTTGSVRAITAPGAITLTRATGPATITALGDYSITSGGALSLINGDASGAAIDHDDSLALTGTGVIVGTIGSTPAGTLVGAGDVVLTATGPLATDGIAAGDVTARAGFSAVAANGGIAAGAIIAGQGVILAAATAIDARGDIAAGTAPASTAGVALTAPVMTLGTTGTAAAITAPGAITLTRASGPVTITTRGDYRITSSGGAVSLIDSDASGATVTQIDSLALTGTSLVVGDILSARVVGDPVVGSRAVRLEATGPLASDSVVAGDVTAGDAGARGDVSAISANGTVTIGAIVAANLLVSSGGAPAVVAGPVAASGNYSVSGTTVTLGTAGTPFSLSAAGAVAITATTGGVTVLGTGGTLQSNLGGTRNGAAGGLTIAARTAIAAPTIDIVANRALSTPDPLTGVAQASMPGASLVADAAGSGGIAVRSIRGGAVSVSAPGTIDLRQLTASGDVAITGTAPVGNDIATIAPLTITIDGAGILGAPVPVEVAVAAGAGAEVTGLGTINGGRVGAFTLRSNTGAATLRGLPATPASVGSVLVESQTGAASIVNATATPFAAGTITLRGRQPGSSATATGPLLTSGDIVATGPSATIGTATSAGGDIVVAATGAARLATGAGETAAAPAGSVTVASTSGLARLGAATAGAAITVRGATATIDRLATAGDDLVIVADAVDVGTATLASTGGLDLQAGDDAMILTRRGVVSEAGTGYGAGATVLGDADAIIASTSSGGGLRQLGGSNIVVTSGGGLVLDAATITAARDLRAEASGSLALGSASAGRDLLGTAGTGVAATGTIDAGDDLVLVAGGGGIDAAAATLVVRGTAGLGSALRADGLIVLDPTSAAPITNLGGSTVALAASGPVTLGAVTTGAAPSSLRVFAGGAVTAQAPLDISGSLVLAGDTVTAAGALTAGDDLVVVARGGAAQLAAGLTTTGLAATDTALTGLSGGVITLGDGTVLGRVEGSSIVVAALGAASVPGIVTSAGRYTVLGRGGVSLGTDGAATLQQAARDVLVEASTGVAPAVASVTLADGMTLAANSDGIEFAAATPGRFVPENLVIGLGNGSLNAGAATIRAGRTAGALLADQGIVIVSPAVADGVKGIAIATLDTASASLRALDAITIGTATIDAGLMLASKAGAASLGTLAVGAAVPLMTAAERGAIDLGIFGATGATLGIVTGTTPRDIIVATVIGVASITGSAAARDDIVIVSTAGTATAAALNFTGAASDSETSVTDPARDADGIALADPFRLDGPAITGLTGRHVVVAGGTGASLAAASDATGDAGGVRVLTASGPASLGTVSGGFVAAVTVGSRSGTASAASLADIGDVRIAGDTAVLTGAGARGTIRVEAGSGGATVGDATAGVDVIVTSGGDATIGTAEARANDVRVTATGDATIGRLLAGNDVAISAGSATLGVVPTGLIAARRDVAITSPGAVTIGTARAGGMVRATGASMTATTLEAGDALTVTATAGDATVATAMTTGRPLLNDYSGFATTGSAPAGTRGIIIIASDVATLASGSAQGGIAVIGDAAGVTTAAADLGGLGGDLVVTGRTRGASLGTGTGRDIIVTTTGTATATGLTATRDLRIDAGAAAALTGGTAGRDAVVTGSSVAIGTLSAGDDVAVVATGGTLTATSLASTGGDALDTVASIARADGSALVDPLTAAPVAGLGGGGNVLVLASGDISVGTVTATAPAGATAPGLVRLAATGTTQVTTATASAGDIALAGSAIDATTLSAGRDIAASAGAGGLRIATIAIARDATLASAGDAAITGTATLSRDLGVTATRDIAIAANAAPGATGLAVGGNATLTAGRDLAVLRRIVTDGTLLANSGGATTLAGFTSGAATLVSGGNLDLTDTATATGALTATSAGGAITATALAGGGIALAAGNGITVTGATTSTAALAATGGSLRFATIDATGDATLRSRGAIDIAGGSRAGGGFTATADTGAITTARVVSGGATTITSTAGATTIASLDATGAATLRARDALAVTGQAKTGTALDAASGAGPVAFGSIAAGTSATVRGATGVFVTGATTAGGALAITTDTGPLTTASLASGGAATITATAGAMTLASLDAGGAALLRARDGLTVTGLARAGGSLDAASGGGAVVLGAATTATTGTIRGATGVTITGATATGGALGITADTGAVTTGSLTNGGATTITATTGGMTLASLTSGGAATLRAGDGIDTGAVRATGAIAATSDTATLRHASLDAGGDATLRARGTLTVTGLARAGGAFDALSSADAVTLGAATAGTTATLRGATGLTVTGATAAGGAVLATADTGALAMGDIAGGDVTATATSGAATLASVGRATRLTVTAATSATMTGPVAASGAYSVTAPQITLGGGRQASGGTTTLASADLALGAGLTLVAPTRLQLNVTGAATGVSFGDGAGAATGANRYALSKAELATIATPILEIDAGARPVDFGDTALPNVTAAFGVRTTGDIRVADRLAFDSPAGSGAGASPRVLTLGGAAGGANLDKTTVTANSVRVLARPTLDNTATGTGGQILAAGSTVQLRATYIALGETPSPDAGRAFIDELLPASGTPLDTPVVRSTFLNNAGSTLYSALPLYAKQTPAPQVLVRSGTLVLAPGKWALIQNTGPTAQPGGGIEVATLQLNRLGGAAAPDPVVGLFGGIAAKTGIVAAVSVSADQLDGISPNNIRINGCVALSTGGCIQSNVAIPLINLADPGRNLLISNAPDLALSIELITGATNEALWREDDDDPAQNRPQRESRP